MGNMTEMRPWVYLTNEAQHRGTSEVSLERMEEKSVVDRLDPVCPRDISPGYYLNLPYLDNCNVHKAISCSVVDANTCIICAAVTCK